MSFLLVESALHVLTISKVLPVHPLITPWPYQGVSAAYALDSHGSPIFVDGYKTYIQKGIPPVRQYFDERGYRPHDSDRFLAEGEKVGFFGDSYTEGLQVEDAETFTRIVENALNGRGEAINIFNFGVGGTGTYHEYLRWLTVSQDVDLDVVVVFFLPQNDVLNNHRELGEPFALKMSPFFSSSQEDARGKGTRELPDTRPKSPKAEERIFWLRRTVGMSFILRSIYYGPSIMSSALLQSAQSRDPVESEEERKVSFAEFWTSQRSVWLDVFGAPASSEWDDAWHATEQIILRFASEVENRGSRFVLVLVADSLQIFFDGGEVSVSGKVHDFSYPNKRLAEFCTRHGIECLDSLPLFLERKKGLNFPYFSWNNDGHYSQLGHSTMAEYLLATLFSATDAKAYGQGVSAEADAPAR